MVNQITFHRRGTITITPKKTATKNTPLSIIPCYGISLFFDRGNYDETVSSTSVIILLLKLSTTIKRV